MNRIGAAALGIAACAGMASIGLMRDQFLAAAKGHLPASATTGGLFARECQ
jgi:hypothetical protein